MVFKKHLLCIYSVKKKLFIRMQPLSNLLHEIMTTVFSVYHDYIPSNKSIHLENNSKHKVVTYFSGFLKGSSWSSNARNINFEGLKNEIINHPIAVINLIQKPMKPKSLLFINNLYDQSNMGFTLMKGGHPGELGENCSWPTCKLKDDLFNVKR